MSNEKIMQTRREKFEEWADELEFCLDCHFFNEGNNYSDPDTFMAFEIWNAALDSIVIELPSCFEGYGYSEEVARVATDCCADAIEYTGLGIKVI